MSTLSDIITYDLHEESGIVGEAITNGRTVRILGPRIYKKWRFTMKHSDVSLFKTILTLAAQHVGVITGVFNHQRTWAGVTYELIIGHRRRASLEPQSFEQGQVQVDEILRLWSEFSNSNLECEVVEFYDDNMVRCVIGLDGKLDGKSYTYVADFSSEDGNHDINVALRNDELPSDEATDGAVSFNSLMTNFASIYSVDPSYSCGNSYGAYRESAVIVECRPDQIDQVAAWGIKSGQTRIGFECNGRFTNVEF